MRRRVEQRRQILRVADVPGVHDDEAVDEPLLARPRIRALARRELLRVGPVRDHGDRVRLDALRDQPPAHPLADRHDSGRARKPEPDEPVEHADEDGVVEPAERDRDLGEDVLRDDDQRHTVAPSDGHADRGDEGRVGETEDEVRPWPSQRRDEGEDDETQVVEPAEREPAPVERGRPDADDLDAVSDRLLRPRRIVNGAGDDGDVVVLCERFAQLGQELRCRLLPRGVVLVEDEQRGPRRRHQRRC